MNDPFNIGDKITVFRRFIDDDSIQILGWTKLHRDGWRFLPNVTSRKGSRKGHATWEASLPRWVNYPNGCETSRRNEAPRP